MKWIEALKKYNQGKEEWCIPKKGSNEYNQVMNIMKPEEKIENIFDNPDFDRSSFEMEKWRNIEALMEINEERKLKGLPLINLKPEREQKEFKLPAKKTAKEIMDNLRYEEGKPRYDLLNVEDLKTLLNEKKIKFKSSSKKIDLISLLNNIKPVVNNKRTAKEIKDNLTFYEDGKPRYDILKVDELKTLLNDKKIKFEKSSKKADLIKLLLKN